MLVVDFEKSERGRQRRKAGARLLHCCCVCGELGIWASQWSTYCSEKEIDDCAPIPKFCSLKCAKMAGIKAENVTEEMKLKAKDSEYREPHIVYRQATSNEKYRAAVDQQVLSRPTLSNRLLDEESAG